MKKTLITTIFLLSVTFIQAQISGSIDFGVEYKGDFVDSSKFETDMMKKQHKERENAARRILEDDIIFTRIEFDKNFATYTTIPNLSSDKIEFNLAIIKRDFLYDKGEQKLYDIKEDRRSQTIYVEYKKHPKINFNYYVEWELKEEYREILGFKCQKAVAVYNDHSEDNPQKSLEAWFTPEIPLSFGPRGFNGLPGLILGLEISGRYYYAKEIEIDEDYTPIFEEEPELLTKEEYDKNHKRW